MEIKAQKAFIICGTITALLFLSIVIVAVETDGVPPPLLVACGVSTLVTLAVGTWYSLCIGRLPAPMKLLVVSVCVSLVVGGISNYTEKNKTAANEEPNVSKRQDANRSMPKEQDSSAKGTRSDSCDKVGAQKIINMVTLGDPPLFLRVKDGSHVRYTFTTSGWIVGSPQTSSKFTQLALGLDEAENCLAGTNAIHIEFYGLADQHVASVSPWTGVSVDGE